LGTDEHEVRHMRTHGKALLLPAVVFVVLAVLMGTVLALLPASWGLVGDLVVVGVTVLLMIVFCLVPFLRWLTTTYTLTNRRIITRSGILSKSGHDLPLRRINNVAYERSMLDRMLGCGSLVLTTAAETPVTLPDVPDVERVHVLMTELLFGTHEAIDDGLDDGVDDDWDEHDEGDARTPRGDLPADE